MLKRAGLGATIVALAMVLSPAIAAAEFAFSSPPDSPLTFVGRVLEDVATGIEHIAEAVGHQIGGLVATLTNGATPSTGTNASFAAAVDASQAPQTVPAQQSSSTDPFGQPAQTATATATTTIAAQVVVEKEQPIVEDVTQTDQTVTPGELHGILSGISEIIRLLPAASASPSPNVESQIAALQSAIFAQTYNAAASPPLGGGASNTIAAASAIDQLSGTSISNPSITGGSITNASLSGGSVSANSLSVSGDTSLSGGLNVGGNFSAGSISFSAASSTGSITTNSTTTNLIATNATSTTLFASIGHFTSGLIDTLTSAVANFGTITATNSFATNSTTTNLVVTGTSTLGNVRLPNTNCSTYGNGGKLTTNALGDVICSADQGGSGSTVAGADSQVQFNSGGGFAGSPSLTFATSTGTLTVPNASTTWLSAASLFATSASIVNATSTYIGLGGQTFSSLLGTGLTDASGTLTVSFSPFTTSNLTEGSNLYFTPNRVASVIAGTTTDALAEGTTNKYFTAARAQSAISISGVPLTYSSGLIGINQASGSQAGYLASGDWTTFNSKVSSTSLSAGTGIGYNSSTGVISNTGVTSNVAGTGISLSGGTGAVTITNSGVTSLTASYPLLTSGGTGALTLSLGFGTTTANSWSNLQTFNAGASSTNISASGEGFFGIASTTNLTVSGSPSGFLQTNVQGVVSATSTFSLSNNVFGTLAIANGGTGLSAAPTYGQVLVGNAVGGYALTSTSSLGIANGGGTWGSIAGTLSSQTDLQNALNAKFSLSNWYATTTDALAEGTTNKYFTAARAQSAISISGVPLTYSSGLIGINQASGSQAGYLASGDWTTFNGKVSSTSLSASYPLAYNNGTGVFSLGFGTTTANIWSSLQTLTSGFLSQASSTVVGNFSVSGNTSLAAATATSLSVSGTASSSAVVASNSLTIGSLTGFLRATAGAIATSLVNLASDVTGLLPVGNGGTGWSSLAAGSIPFGNGGSALATTSAGVAGQVLALLNGVPTWTSTTTLSTISGTLLAGLGGTGSTTLSGIVVGNGTAAVNTATIASPLSLSGATLSLGVGSSLSTSGGNLILNLGNANAWTALQTLNGGASTTNVSASGEGVFGSASTTNLTIGAPSALLSTNASGVVGSAAFSSGLSFSGGTLTLGVSGVLGVANGGTASTTLGGILSGNGVGAVSSAIVTSPLSFSSNTLSIQQASGSQAGYLASTDWMTFNNKVSSTSLSASYPLSYSNSGVFSLGFGTTTTNAWSNLQTLTSGFLSQASSTVVGAFAATGVGTFGSTFSVSGLSTLAGLISNASSTFTGILNAGTLNLTNALTVANGGTGTATFGQGWLYSSGGTGALAASTSPTVNYLTATSTTQASTLGYRLGIGTSTPDSLLTLYAATKPSLEYSAGVGGPQWTEGIDTSNGGNFEIASSTALGTNARFVINGAGNVGIGTSSPSHTLSVQGSGLFSGTLSSSAISITGTPLIAGFFSGLNTNFGSFVSQSTASNTAPEIASYSSLLSSNGAGTANSFKIANASVILAAAGSGDAWAGNDVITANSGVGNQTIIGREIDFNNNNMDYSGAIAYPFASAVYITGTGSKKAQAAILVNSASPLWYRGISFTGANVASTTFEDATNADNSYVLTGTHTNGIDLSGATISGAAFKSNGFFVSGNGNVGIGTISPTSTLEVYKAANAAQGGEIVLGNNGSNFNNSTALTYLDGMTYRAQLQMVTESPSASGDFRFLTGLAGVESGLTERMRITAAGNVGIGTTSPVSNANYGGLSLNGTSGSNFSLMTNGSESGRLQEDSNGLIVNEISNLPILLQTNNTERVRILTGGNVGIGTTTPYSRMEVWGPDTASTSAFAVVNNASTTEFTVYDTGNATLAGSLVQNSDQRLKTNIQDLDSSSSLAALRALNPVTFNWIDPSKNSVPQYGFVAQQVQSIFPNLVSTTSPTALTPDGTLSLNYIDLIAPIVKAIQQLDQELTSLASTVASFADHFTSKEITFIRATGDDLIVKKFHTQELCAQKSDGSELCVTGDQLAAVLTAFGQTPSSSAVSPPSTQVSNASTSPGTPPVIQINGDNPAIIQVGAIYNDLGATITGPQADLNLGIKTFLNGALVSNIVLDTSAVATDTIDYVVTDAQGLTSTSTRTVIIDPAADIASPPPSSSTDASSSATTTVQ